MRALFLANLGTPDQPNEEKVRAYLAQFLMDPKVIDIPSVMRWLLVHGMILRTRPRASAEAYQKIWTDRGSPLLFHLQDLTQQVAQLLGADWIVEHGMRYGSPSFDQGLIRLKKFSLKTHGVDHVVDEDVNEVVNEVVDEIVFLPLFPQYSEAATGSAIEEFRAAVRRVGFSGKVREIAWFYDQPAYQKAAAQITGESFSQARADHLLFSFHGLPQRQLKKASGGQGCLKDACCAEINPANRRCYRAQCFATAHAQARELGLASTQYSISFQSRLGRTPWIHPYTEEIYQELVNRGVRRLAVACPSFVADCLETLEEIRIRGRERFIELGGEDLILLPSLNADPRWVSAVANLVQPHGAGV